MNDELSKNICLITGLFPIEREEEYFNAAKHNLMNSANTLSWGILKALIAQNRIVDLINAPFIPSFPDNSSIRYVPYEAFKIDGVRSAENIYFNNLAFYKYRSIARHIAKALLKWVSIDEKNRVVIIYNLYSPFLSAVIRVKKSYPDLKIVSVVPDIPKYMGFGQSIKQKLFRKVNSKLVDKALPQIDAFIFLTKYMNDALNKFNKPWTVIEGIFQIKNLPSPNKVQPQNNIVLYSGDLSEVYGVRNLVNAFTRFHNSSCQLIICGKGDSEKYIIEKSKTDSRIIFKGLALHKDILELQQSASLLVNPRDAKGEFTKYSFPSKTLEYFASGTPSLICKLPGIPEEYYKFCFCCDRMDEDTILEQFNKIFAQDKSTRDELGKSAQEFVLKEKTEKIQGKKIVSLVEQIENA